MKLSFSQLSVFGEDLAGDKILIKVSFGAAFFSKQNQEIILRVPGFIPLKYLSSPNILFLLNVSFLMDRCVDCFFPGITVGEKEECKSICPQLGILQSCI